MIMIFLETTYLILYKWINQHIPTFLKVDDVLAILAMSFLAFMNLRVLSVVLQFKTDYTFLPLYLTYGFMAFFYFTLLRRHSQILSLRIANNTYRFRKLLVLYIFGSFISFLITLPWSGV